MMGMGGGGMLGFMSGGNTPQDRGFGIQNPGSFAPYQSSPGMGGANTAGLQSLDISGPGASELFYGNNQDAYQTPGQTENWWNRNQGQFGQAGTGETYANAALNRYFGREPQGTNIQQQTYDQFQQDRPNIATDPGLSPYYANARKVGQEALNNQMAARGGFNSSAGLDQLNTFNQGLAGDQANREAQYNLQRLGEQRAWDQLGGQLASGLDQNALANSQNQMGWAQALGGLANQGQGMQLSRLNAGMSGAGNADTAMLNRLNQGMSAANTTQQNQMQRAQQLFGNQMTLGGALSDMAGNTYNQMLGSDQQLMDAAMASEMGLANEATNQGYRGQQQNRQGLSDAMSIVGMGGLGGGGGGGGSLLGGII